MKAQSIERPLRVGVLGTIVQGDLAVRKLMEAGLTTDQITVIGSEHHVDRHFKQFEHQLPAGSMTPGAVKKGSAIGVLGGLGAIAGALTTGDAGLFAAS